MHVRLLQDQDEDAAIGAIIDQQSIAITKRVDELTASIDSLIINYRCIVSLKGGLDSQIAFYYKPKGTIFDSRWWQSNAACLEQIEKTTDAIKIKLNEMEKQPSVSQLVQDAKAEQGRLAKENMAQAELVRVKTTAIDVRLTTLIQEEQNARKAIGNFDAKNLVNCLETYRKKIEIENPPYAKHLAELAGNLDAAIRKVFIEKPSQICAKK